MAAASGGFALEGEESHLKELVGLWDRFKVLVKILCIVLVARGYKARTELDQGGHVSPAEINTGGLRASSPPLLSPPTWANRLPPMTPPPRFAPTSPPHNGSNRNMPSTPPLPRFPPSNPPLSPTFAPSRTTVSYAPLADTVRHYLFGEREAAPGASDEPLPPQACTGSKESTQSWRQAGSGALHGQQGLAQRHSPLAQDPVSLAGSDPDRKPPDLLSSWYAAALKLVGPDNAKDPKDRASKELPNPGSAPVGPSKTDRLNRTAKGGFVSPSGGPRWWPLGRDPKPLGMEATAR